MPGFWDNFGRSAVSSMQQTAPYGLEILRNKAAQAQAAQQAREKQIQEILGVVQDLPVGDPGRNAALDLPQVQKNPIANILKLQKPKYDPEVFKTEYETFMKLPQAKRKELWEQQKTTGGAEKYGPFSQTFEYGAELPDKKDYKIVNKGSAIIDMNDPTNIIRLEEGKEYLSIDPETNTVRIWNPKTQQVETQFLGNKTIEDVEGGMVVGKEVGSTGTKISDTTKKLVDEMWNLNKQKVEMELTKKYQAKGQKIPPGLSDKFNSYDLARKEIRKIKSLLFPSKDSDDEAKSNAKAIHEYMGGGWGGAINRAIQTEKGGILGWNMHPAVTGFNSHVKMLMDIRRRGESGSAMNQSEEAFYEELIGGAEFEPDYLIARFDSIDEMLAMGIQSMYEAGDAVGGNTGESTKEMSDDEAIQKALENDEEAIRIVRERGLIKKK